MGILAVLGATGCFAKPNKANIELRKEVQSLHEQIDKLNSQHAADRATIDTLSKDRTVQTLAPEKIDRLFTTSGIKFKNLVIGEDLDANLPGDEGFKIGVVPLDTVGDEFKAAGSFTIELFDLAEPNVRLGQWSIPTDEARQKWLSSFVFDGYVFHFKWQTPPTHEKLLVKATFVEELTGRTFDATSELKINPPKQ